MKIEFDIKDIDRDEMIAAMAHNLLHRWSDDNGDSPTDLGRLLGRAVKAKIEEVAKELVRQHFDTVIHERIAAAVDAVIADGWYETDGYGGRKGEKMDLRARVSRAMTEPRRDSGGYNNKPSLIAERIDEAAKGFLDKELRGEVDKAKAALRAKLDTSVMDTVAAAVKSAIGLQASR